MHIVYFVRHGENPANLTREFSHRNVDYSLTSKGVAQAQQTAAYFQDQPIDAIYTSPLKRAYETADIIGGALGLPVTVVEEFREVNTGVLEEAPPTPEAWALHDRIIRDWTHGTPESRFPGGEDYFTLLARVRAGLTRVLDSAPGRNLVIVTHGGIIAATLRNLCPGVDFTGLNMHIETCSISRFAFTLSDGEPQGRLLDWASCAHLPQAGGTAPAGPAAPTQTVGM